MNIGELSRRTKLTPATIRFYEEAGLLDARHVRRRQNNYRDYDRAAVEHLRLIREAQSAGFSLAEFKALEEACAEGSNAGSIAAELLSAKVRTVKGRIAELRRVLRFLEGKLAELGAGES